MKTVHDLLTRLTRLWPPPENCNHSVHLGPEGKLAITVHVDGQMQTFLFEPEDLARTAHALVDDIRQAWVAPKSLEPLCLVCGKERAAHPHDDCPAYHACRAGKDGACFWEGCPQLRDGEPEKSGRHCPLDNADAHYH